MKFNEYIKETTVSPKQQKAVNDLKKKGWYVVTWEIDEFVSMMDKKGNLAEIYKDGNIEYP